MKTSSRRTTATKVTRRPAPASKKKAAPVRTANLDKAIKDYEEALRAFSRKEFSKAGHLFEDIVKEYPTEREVCDRARMYLAVCKAQSPSQPTRPKAPDDFYYLGVVAANDGRLEAAAELFDKALQQDPRSDKAWYALAAVCALRSDRAGVITNLSKAIELKPNNKALAANDTDFDLLREDPEFMSLLGKASKGGA